MADCHQAVPDRISPPSLALSAGTGFPRPALALGGALGLVGLVALAVVALVPFESAAFGA